VGSRVFQLAVATALIMPLAAACSSTTPAARSPEDASPTPIGGAAAHELCSVDQRNPAALPFLIEQLDNVQFTVDFTTLTQSLVTGLDTMRRLELEPDSDAAEWRDAAVDSVTEVQPLIGGADAAQAARLAADTLRGLTGAICPPSRTTPIPGAPAPAPATARPL
jgi:hypothetical protein